MANNATTPITMRILHRYLGFFLAGIMLMYSLSGVLLIFRDTDFLKNIEIKEQTLEANLPLEEVGKAIKIKNLKAETENETRVDFKQGYYEKQSGLVKYEVKSLPLLLDKMTKLHKANVKDPLYYFNIFFGASLLFFVISSFWMFLPKTTIFKKGMYFTFAGLLLTLLLIYLR